MTSITKQKKRGSPPSPDSRPDHFHFYLIVHHSLSLCCCWHMNSWAYQHCNTTNNTRICINIATHMAQHCTHTQVARHIEGVTGCYFLLLQLIVMICYRSPLLQIYLVGPYLIFWCLSILVIFLTRCFHCFVEFRPFPPVARADTRENGLEYVGT